MKTVYLVQPPFVQLNSPYPSLYYLRAFLEQRGHSVTVLDNSIGLFEIIFCREGLSRIFDDAKKLLADRSGSINPLIARFISDEDRWLSSIDRIVAYLRGLDHEWGHFAALAHGTLPDGLRFHNCLAGLCEQNGRAGPDDAPLLATKLLADIADFITQTLDTNFSLIRYMSSTASAGTYNDFDMIVNNMDGYIMRHFYRPFLEAQWRELEANSHCHIPDKFYLGLSIPFPGCLAGALVCAESAKAFFGDKVVVIAGGGYINTELRYLEDERLFNYVDYLSFDRGYSSLDAILNNNKFMHKTMYRGTDGVIIFNNNGTSLDDESAVQIFPDYSGVDFSRYIRPVDDANPMHRLWSDGRWLKAYLAHGCYWRQCAFCDTGLDYINAYKPVDIDLLFRHLLAQAQASGVWGVHLVDEACPPASLLRLALLNREAGLPLVFWGNIRFEKNFSPDAAAILAAGGLVGVSAGIEVATERGFLRINKGINLQGVVNVCAAFKEAGILVHAYCIYGWWDQDEQEIINSAETLRQFFSEGLLDSAFWHQFTLTKHSRVYAEQQKGLHPRLEPRGDLTEKSNRGKKIFALNDLSFTGEARFNRYNEPLSRLLEQWTRGDTSWPRRHPLSRHTIDPGLIQSLLQNYRTTLPPDTPLQSSHVIFLAAKPYVRARGTESELRWLWRFEDRVLRIQSALVSDTLTLLETAACGSGMNAEIFFNRLQIIFNNDVKRIWKKLRKQGLCLW